MELLSKTKNIQDRRRIKHGVFVQVRSASEIFATLDEEGKTGGMPFMPEMLKFCGKTYRVASRIAQTCTEVGKVRRLSGAVHLADLRCDGSAHENCGRCCSLFWKEAWLKEVTSEEAASSLPSNDPSPSPPLHVQDAEGRYICQSTALFHATEPLIRWDPRRWYQGLLHRGLAPLTAIRYFTFPIVTKIGSILAGRDLGQLTGTNKKTPEEILNLQPGELVEVKGRAEIIATLDNRGKNHGLLFTPDMLPFIGKRYLVKQRVERLIDESSGHLRKPKHTVLLEAATCDGSSICGGCARQSYHLWREIWLKRVSWETDKKA